MNLHRLNHNTFESQIFTEESIYDAKHTLNLSEFFKTQNRSNKIDKFNSHITRLFSTESYKVFLALNVCILACLLRTEPW